MPLRKVGFVSDLGQGGERLASFRLLMLLYNSTPSPTSTGIPFNSMASTSSSTIYVGNLAAHLDESALAAAFAPFGDIVSVSLPTSAPAGSAQRKNKGFGFVTFSSPDDALDALDNMHLNALNGRTIHVKLADKEQPKQASNRAVWTDEDWLKQYDGAETTEQEPETKEEEAT